MNRRTWIAGVTVTAILAVSLTACKQERKEQETVQNAARHGSFFPTH